MKKSKKCVVWDLDNTIWDGICLEGDVKLRPYIQQTIEELDSRGILNSIASRGEEDVSMKILQDYNLDSFFLVPKINWNSKSTNIISISEELRIALDTIVYIDDDVFELEQVAFMIPDVITIEANRAIELTKMTVLKPPIITKEARSRRQFYQAEQQRNQSKNLFPTREAFLKSCAMKLKVRSMTEEDIPRVLELMTRTHQLNTTGRIFHQNELLEILHNGSDTIEIKVAELNDKFGAYGTVGVAIIEMNKTIWRLLYLAISCRVLGRGIERTFLTSLLNHSTEKGYNYAEALFRDSGRNKMMRGLYQMLGFRKYGINDEDQSLKFRIKISEIPNAPRWMEVI